MGNTLHPHHLYDPRILAEVLEEEILAAAFENEEISSDNKQAKPQEELHLAIETDPLPRWGEEKISPNAELNDISAKTRLAITLRWLAGGSYLIFVLVFGIAYGTYTFFKENGVLWGRIYAIDHDLKIKFPWDDVNELEEISNGFSDTAEQFFNDHNSDSWEQLMQSLNGTADNSSLRRIGITSFM
eukprot:gene19140-27111_t